MRLDTKIPSRCSLASLFLVALFNCHSCLGYQTVYPCANHHHGCTGSGSSSGSGGMQLGQYQQGSSLICSPFRLCEIHSGRKTGSLLALGRGLGHTLNRQKGWRSAQISAASGIVLRLQLPHSTAAKKGKHTRQT